MNATKWLTSGEAGTSARMRAAASATLRLERNIEAVRMFDIAHDLRAEAAALQSDEIQAVQPGAVAGGVAERRDVL